MSIPTIARLPRTELLPVLSAIELLYLVLEHESVTGDAGRDVVIHGAERLAYHVEWSPFMFRIRRLDATVDDHQEWNLAQAEFETHGLGEAIRAGMLFAQPLTR
jgi:hypothetical protein